MKNYILVIFFIFLSACMATKPGTKKRIASEFEIVKIPIIIKSDTVIVNELRFYEIKSAMDGMMLMYQNYGKWDAKIIGKHQSNINRLIWQDNKLFEDISETFTIIADGTETLNEYYACLMVFDSKEKDCFDINHPYREKLSELFNDKMKNTDKELPIYKLFR